MLFYRNFSRSFKLTLLALQALSWYYLFKQPITRNITLINFFRRFQRQPSFTRPKLTSETIHAIWEGRKRLAEQVTPFFEELFKNPLRDNKTNVFSKIALFLPTKSRKVLEDTLNSYTPPNSWIVSLYSVGEALLPPEVFEEITTTAAGLPQLQKVTLDYINQDKDKMQQLKRAQQLQTVLLEPSIRNFNNLLANPELPTKEEMTLVNVIVRRLNAEVNSLKPSIAEYAGADTIGTQSTKNTEKLATKRAKISIPTLLVFLERAINAQNNKLREVLSLKDVIPNTVRLNTVRFNTTVRLPVAMRLRSMTNRQAELKRLLEKITKIPTD